MGRRPALGEVGGKEVGQPLCALGHGFPIGVGERAGDHEVEEGEELCSHVDLS